MKISSETKAILKNFATINSGIKVDSGNQLKTISNMKNILAVATIPETFDKSFRIYNLVEFLRATSHRLKCKCVACILQPRFTFITYIKRALTVLCSPFCFASDSWL